MRQEFLSGVLRCCVSWAVEPEQFVYSGSIENFDFELLSLNRRRNPVSSCACYVGYDCLRLTGKGIKQRAFAGIGRPGDNGFYGFQNIPDGFRSFEDVFACLFDSVEVYRFKIVEPFSGNSAKPFVRLIGN